MMPTILAVLSSATLSLQLFFGVDVLNVMMDGTPQGVTCWCHLQLLLQINHFRTLFGEYVTKYTIMTARASGLVNPITTRPAYALVHTHGCRKIGAW
jgi:hypothetical protein